MKHPQQEFPREFAVQAAGVTTRYELADDYYVVFGQGSQETHLNVAFRIEEGNITVCRGVPSKGALHPDGTKISAVYRREHNGPFAVPTGEVFIRFEENTRMEPRRAEIEKAGFTIRQVLSYAPHAGWVRPTSGRISDAIIQYARLKQIDGIQLVQPQMLMRVGQR